MKQYRTFMIVKKKSADLIKQLDFSSADFHITFAPEPTNCFWESFDGKSEIHYGQGKVKTSNDGEVKLSELIIVAKDESIAENALSLIKGGILLAFPTPHVSFDRLYISEINKNDNSFYAQNIRYFQKIEDTSFGCKVLEKIVNNRPCAYALEKYKISLELLSFNPLAADPIRGQVFPHYDFKKETHTRAAFAIVTAFSVIEELGLEIRSSANKKRFLSLKPVEWNSQVLEDIENRLLKNGIAKDSTFDWIFRGEQTEVEKNLKPYFGIDSQWVTYNDMVRDRTLTFPEAIHNASFLRNFIAAHKFNDLTQFISPYDVFNVQCLARKLILESLGMWELMLNRHKNLC